MALAMGVSIASPSPLSRLPACPEVDKFRRAVVDSFEYARRADSDLTPHEAQQISDRILAGFVESMRVASGQEEAIDYSSTLRRRLAVMNVAEYVTSCLATSPSLADMSVFGEMSERSLRNGFREAFGVSPVRFIKSHRLSV